MENVSGYQSAKQTDLIDGMGEDCIPQTGENATADSKQLSQAEQYSFTNHHSTSNQQHRIDQLANQLADMQRMMAQLLALNEMQNKFTTKDPVGPAVVPSGSPTPSIVSELIPSTSSETSEAANVAPISSTRIEAHDDVAVRQAIPINQINPETFDGDKTRARAWISEYENLMRINGYDGQQKVSRALAYLTGPARSWYNVTMNLNKRLEWPGFKREFLKHFCGADGKAQLRKKLDESVQHSDEHPSTFVMRILDLCLQLNCNMTEQEKIDRISNGLDVDIVNQLQLVKDPDDWSLEWLMKSLSNWKSKNDRQKSETSRRLQQQRKPPPQLQAPSRSQKEITKPKNIEDWMCFNCGDKGHIIEDCPKARDEEAIRARKNAYREEKEKSRDIKAIFSQDITPLTQMAKLPCDLLPKAKATFDVNGTKLEGRIDSGADMSVIPSDVADNLDLKLLPWNQPRLKACNNNTLEVLGMAAVVVTYNNTSQPLLVAVLPNSCLKETLWGNDILHLIGINLDYGATKRTNQHNDVVVNSPRIIASSSKEPQHPVDKVAFGELNQNDRKEFEALLTDFGDTFSKHKLDLGRTSTVKHRIHLTDDKPVHKPFFRLSKCHKVEMERHIEAGLESGALRPSTSQYASAAFFVPKDGGQDLRMVIDYRPLNQKTIPDRQPMPHPEDVFSMLAGMEVFAKLDITAMFNQIEVDERDIHKTAMITPMGLFECPLMPFGLINAPATAVRLMREVLRGIDGVTCYVYFDDIIIFARDVPQLIGNCREVLKRLRKHNLKLKPAKCVFGVTQVNFLGHVISPKGVEIDPRRIQSVQGFPIPKDTSDVRSFHGLCSYNRKFIRGFADIAKPLTPLMGKPSDFHWTAEAQVAFETLRDALTKAPILVHFDYEAEHELRTDASSHAMGAVLVQKHVKDSHSGVVLYWSKTLTSTQRNYSATERELLAAFSAIMALQHYLLGKHFTLVTDHQALSLLNNHKDPHRRLARWVAQLQGFDFDVRYRSGSKHKDADCMSRLIAIHDSDDLNNSRTINQIIREDVLEEEPDIIDEDTIDIAAEQRADAFCKKYIDILESDASEAEKRRRARSFAIQDNCLYKMTASDILVLVVPERRRSAVLRSCHDAPLAGHLGVSRTYSLIKCRYFWPKMRRDIKRHCAACVPCQRRKVSNTKKQGLTQPLPIAEDVFDTIGIDLIVKLPVSSQGYNTILVCVDHLSKYVVTVPLVGESATTIIHGFFNNFVARYGCPRLVVSDQGKNIEGLDSREFYRLFGIKRCRTSGYHPQTNGQTERFNRTLGTSLTMYVERTQHDWPDFLQALTFAYNITRHSVTGVAPFELVFGRRPRLPVDNMMNLLSFIDPAKPSSGARCAAEMIATKKLIEKNQQANKRRLDAHLEPTSFQEGDLVLLERPERIKGAAHKLSYTFIGPYRIQRKLSDLTFEIAPVARPEKRSCVHPHHLRKFIAPLEVNEEDDILDPKFIPRPAEYEHLATVPDADTDTASEAESDSEIESPEFEPLTPRR